jgi:dTDP-4-amino-4,6-dideoxygalactose transaminase
MIPFSPPRVDEKTVKAVTEALMSGWISTGPKTREFEEKLAAYLQTDHVVALNSATAGMQIILKWLGIGPGDEVIVPAYTYCATANVVIHRGATPVMVDVNEDDFNINVDAIRKVITSRTKAIIAVDIAGFPADYDEIFALVNDEEIKKQFSPSSPVQEKLGRIMVIADAAHSIGAKYKGQFTGHQADMSSFSFHAVKNLTTAEGGAVMFNVADKFDHAKLKQDFKVSSLHGQTKDAFSKMQLGNWRYDIIEAGFKCNMTDLQAAIGLVELDRYEDTLKRRKEIFDRYTEGFKDCSWAKITPYETSDKISSYHLFLLKIKGATEATRDRIIEEISKHEIAVNVHYIPLPMLTFYKNMGFKMEDFPVAYRNFSCEISLPVFYNLTNEQVDEVVEKLIGSVEFVLNVHN